MTAPEIIALLPYKSPFLFVDAIETISGNAVKGHYTFKETEYFYEGHFKNQPVTPGVILTECMAQIGLVCLGIYLFKDENLENQNILVALTSHQIDFYLPVLPKEKITVISEKEYFRFNKLKCRVKMLNEQNELVCKGSISGMIKSQGYD
ncbi:3-hydroxyacyl-ACP dehydratase FabZ family protein [Paucihalobacter sp.]|uniref:3-hydroxyacyl-ACP dehydratase FabZ family protein n=1 Tax=Paucihalobacter sp. TaxID=2850405 RepID=UPI002FE080B7